VAGTCLAKAEARPGLEPGSAERETTVMNTVMLQSEALLVALLVVFRLLRIITWNAAAMYAIAGVIAWLTGESPLLGAAFCYAWCLHSEVTAALPEVERLRATVAEQEDRLHDLNEALDDVQGRLDNLKSERAA
jgi:hypothetical protein